MVPTAASTDPTLRTAEHPHSDATAAPPSLQDAGAAGAGHGMGEVSPAVELAVIDLARLIADGSHDDVEALGTIARVASRLAGRHGGSAASVAERVLDEERPVASAGSWSLSNGMLNVVLGEN
jgi:hypothetical protein